MMKKEVEPIYKKVGEKICALRKEAGWNQQQLADQIGTSLSMVYQSEKGKLRFSSFNLFVFAGAFGVHPSVLLENITTDDVIDLFNSQEGPKISF